jgi:DNA-binding CsgD family transcriptional regulator
MTRSPTHLIDSLFAGVLEDPPWMAFLEQLEDSLPCHNSTIVLRKPRAGDPGVLISPHGNRQALSLLSERMFKHSPFLDLPERRVCTFHEMLTPTTRPLYAEYIDYLRAFGVTDLLGLDLIDPQSRLTLRLRCSRAEGEPQFGGRERALLQKLLPRLETAIAIYGRLAAQRNELYVYDETSARLAIGALLLNESGAVLIKNSVADRLLETGDGLYLEDGILRFTDADGEKIFRARFAAAVASQHGDDPAIATVKVRRTGDGHWSILLRPAGQRVALGDNTGAAVLVLIRDAGAKAHTSGVMLIEWFGLTRAEAALAVQLVQGRSLDEAAAALGISRYTARTQLAAIFAKTATHRQPQLVGLLLNTINTVWG